LDKHARILVIDGESIRNTMKAIGALACPDITC
jgi:hypothetical protein